MAKLVNSAVQLHIVQHFWRQFAWTLITSIIVLGVLLGLGVLMTPSWKVMPLKSHLTVASADTSISAKNIDPPAEGTYQVKETQLKLTVSGKHQVNAILREPIGAPQNRPACEFVHGSGTGLASEAYGDIASAMASAGITTLVQDKRLDNYTALNRNYQSSAEDYLDGIQYLRETNGVDPSKVGVYAESEGTWIATIMAKHDPSIAFNVLVSAPVYSARQQMAMAATEYLHMIGAPEDVDNIIPKLVSLNFAPFGLAYADFNASDYRDALTMPLLVVYGTLDPSMPVEQGAQRLIADAEKAGNTNVLVRYYSTNHQIRTGSALSLPGLQLAPNYTHDLENWVHDVAAGATQSDWQTPRIAGTQPYQQYAVPQNVVPGCIPSLIVILAMLAFSLITWIITVLACIVLHARREKTVAVSTDDNGRMLVHRYTIQTKTLIIFNIILTPVITIGTIAYFIFTAKSALKLLDEATVLSIGWTCLQIASCISILLLCWLWVRLFFFYGPGNIDSNSQKTDARMSRGHSWVIGCLSVSVLMALALETFFGLISF